jgi:hypothetical protein
MGADCAVRLVSWKRDDLRTSGAWCPAGKAREKSEHSGHLGAMSHAPRGIPAREFSEASRFQRLGKWRFGL